MKIGLLKEINAGEKRVALLPANVARLKEKGLEILVEQGAGLASAIADSDYTEAGASLVSREQVFADAELLLSVTIKGDQAEQIDAQIQSGQWLLGMMDPLAQAQQVAQYADKGVTALALELVPRITRAQSMDVLSSMATIAGYKAVLIAAERAPRLFPMMMTAAGTLKPARVFVMGAGVAGLQACATAKRLGAVVEAYDIRPAAREQILSVGARPVELNIEDSATESKGGYATEQSDDFIARQQAAMADVLAQQDVVITTAAIPGRPAPKLITAEMVKGMKPGTVIVDLAAETGGNCELTQLDVEVVENGVTIIGPSNMPSMAATHASQMFATNIENLLNLMVNEGQVTLDFEDEILKDTTVSHEGQIISPRLRDVLGLDKPTEESE
ncbi:Re/Si-specific NAD(P)(+) transhydrogenase subunit alpha [Paraferrimonas sedimenticola]|uniref:NAD(P) transhydrogenase subunit alpha part 1 n=1 Tax=Paraferrimonas sedimenticola TaxID=375674 RepID=A0AA37RVU3_9GAMM|nr:Re/Si-specific NAD(P)(+) transhydrogenase subunit alpha [Paraferrimonas sedimenticola]GLP95662.1 NAD(P) transhydrogenase subunit alpha [Paraferrimonas sedimenticola]